MKNRLLIVSVLSLQGCTIPTPLPSSTNMIMSSVPTLSIEAHTPVAWTLVDDSSVTL